MDQTAQTIVVYKRVVPGALEWPLLAPDLPRRRCIAARPSVVANSNKVISSFLGIIVDLLVILAKGPGDPGNGLGGPEPSLLLHYRVKGSARKSYCFSQKR